MAHLLLILISLLGLSAHLKADNEIIKPVLWSSSSGTPNEELTLACNISEKQDASQLSWWKNDKRKGSGRYLKIKIRKPSDVGSYICKKNDELLSRTTVYFWKVDRNNNTVQPNLEQDNDSQNYLKCRAKNHSGMFTCFWKLKSFDSKYHLKFKITVIKGNIACEEPVEMEPGKYSVSCTKNNSCPSTEEYIQTELSLEVFYGYLYEIYYRSFFIKDILQPDTSECEIDEHGILTWKPPTTWNTPHTYFPLTYEIKIVHNNRERLLCEHAAQLQHGGTLSCSTSQFHSGKFYVRSRDRYKTNSFWSEWSDPCRFLKQSNKENAKAEQCKCKRTEAGN
uniref:Interleukin-12 subunit beta n=1 Tax=Salvator merianae TaxID=96440 RepID=A0A8D0B0C5_SALMN